MKRPFTHTQGTLKPFQNIHYGQIKPTLSPHKKTSKFIPKFKVTPNFKLQVFWLHKPNPHSNGHTAFPTTHKHPQAYFKHVSFTKFPQKPQQCPAVITFPQFSIPYISSDKILPFHNLAKTSKETYLISSCLTFSQLTTSSNSQNLKHLL